MFTNSWSISSVTVMILELAWNHLWVVIMLENSFARSTFAISSQPLLMIPAGPPFGLRACDSPALAPMV